MPTRTINEGFKEFLSKLTPTSGDTEASKKHRASIKICLENNFDMTNFFRTGSFGNGTSIHGYSDVDYFAVIPAKKLNEESNKSLKEVRDVLNARSPSTGVRVSCPAISLPFGSEAKESTEIVPADYIKNDSNDYRIYDIPDCNNQWMKASPNAHNDYVRYNDIRLDNKLKILIRFIKAWKFYCNVPILSFYLELRVTKLSENRGFIEYSEDLYNVLKKLSDCDLAKMIDPKGISGYIAPCRTDNQLEDSKSKLSTALTRAEKAFEAIQKDDIKEAFYWYNKLFNDKFPSYYK